MKKTWRIPIVVVAAVLVLCAVAVGAAAAKGLDCSVGRYLEAENGAAMVVLDNSPIQMSDRTGKDLFDDLETGDKVFVVHDGIAESYPGKTGAYAIIKLEDGEAGDIPQSVVEGLTELGWLKAEPMTDTNDAAQPGGTPVGEAFDIAVSYANWTDDERIYTNALNAGKMPISAVRHLPIYRFDTLAELDGFKETFGDVLSMHYSYGGVASFCDVTAGYDESFFAENTLMLTYVTAGSGSLRFGVSSVFCDGMSFCIHVEQTNNPEIGTCDMAGWFITVAVPDSVVASCVEFDADLNNDLA